MTEVMLISVPALMFGLWMWRDSQLLVLKVEKAEQLMEDDIPEKDAMVGQALVSQIV